MSNHTQHINCESNNQQNALEEYRKQLLTEVNVKLEKKRLLLKHLREIRQSAEIFKAKKMIRDKNVQFLIKFIESTDEDKFEEMKNICLADKSIGLCYQTLYDGLPMNKCLNKEQIKSHFAKKRVRSIHYFNYFINNIRVGDKIMLGKSRDKALYLVEVAGPCYFTNEEKYQGYNHRIRFTNIIKLPQDFKIKLKNSRIKMTHAIIKNGLFAVLNWF